MPSFLDPQTWISLATLTLMEIVLGVDNIVFISLLAGRLPPAEQDAGRRVGILLALILRVAMLTAISWIAGLTHPLFSLVGFAISGRDIIMLSGGLFLIGKSTTEIHDKLEGGGGAEGKERETAKFWGVMLQIVTLDIVFSLDSVITAVGLVDELPIMIVAVVAALFVMMAFAKAVSGFVNRHPTVKMLALSFLLMIGFLLLADGFHLHVPKGYVYFAMAFSLCVELLNIRVRSRSRPVRLRDEPRV